MKPMFAAPIAALAALAAFSACGNPYSSPKSTETDLEALGFNRTFSITDQTGKVWDITHAVLEYGLMPSRFQYGLGPGAIPPIMDPQMVSPGEVGYPSDDEASFEILGTRLNGQTRAYPIMGVLSAREIINEKIGATHLAVGF